MRRIRPFFRLSLRRDDLLQHDVDAEVAFHIQERIDALVARGWSAAEAEREARRRFGDDATARDALLETARQRERRLTLLEWIDAVRIDARITWRQLRAAPAFAFGTIAAFALGVGANATMFNVVDRLLFRAPPHIVAPGDVYQLQTLERTHASYPQFAALRDGLRGAASVTAEMSIGGALGGISFGRGESARSVQASFVDGDYFRLLGVRAALGRLVGEDDVRLPDGRQVAVLGFAFWQTVFGADSSVIGKEITVGTERFVVIGVTPDGFNGVGHQRCDVWLPLTRAGGLTYIGPTWATTRSTWLTVVVRIPATVDPLRIERRATMANRAFQSQFPVRDTSAVAFHSIIPSRAGPYTPDARVASLLALVSFAVLLIACSNAANLMLARALGRRREIAVRMALGISRTRLIVQLLADSLILALLGSVGAIVVAAGGSAVMRAVLLEGITWDGLLLDARTFAYIGIASLFAGLVAGFAPALSVVRHLDIASVMAEERQSGGVRRQRLMKTLVVAQTALSAVLLIGALLFTRSLSHVRRVPLGFDADNALVVAPDARTLTALSSDPAIAFEQMRERLSHVAGVTHVAIAEGTPYWWHFGTRLTISGRELNTAERAMKPFLSAVTSDYFAAIGTRIIRGRGFADADDRATNERIAIIGANLATALWPAGDAVGHCVRLGDDSMPCRRIVGVAEEVRESPVDPGEASASSVYVPLSQGNHALRGRVVIAHLSTMTPDVLARVQRAVQGGDPNAPFVDMWPLRTRLDPQLRSWRLGATMFGAFGGLALVLAALGLYSVIAYGVAQRRHEVAIRITLGARASDVVAMIGRQGVGLTLVGVVVAIVLATALAPLVQPLLFETAARSPLLYGGVAVTMLLVALVASLVPASSAARTDAMKVIRSE